MNEQLIAEASKTGVISCGQVIRAVSKLPCYRYGALRPGGYNHQYYNPGEDPCDNARTNAGLEKIDGEHAPIPNRNHILSEICLYCPVFAPASAELASILPIP